MEANEDVASTFHVDELFHSVMEKKWNEVLRAYQMHPSARKAKVTKSEETALHLAVLSYHADQDHALEHVGWIRKLVDTFPDGEEVEILGISNDRGNTPLHFAAALGSVDICRCIAKDHKLLEKRNHSNETPFFLAAKTGKLGAFMCLCEVWENGAEAHPDVSLFRRNDGHNILHEAIRGEYFELAYHIILKYGKLVHGKNVEGLSPLHILARKPRVFQSCSNLQLYDRIIYHCLMVSKLKVKDLGSESYKKCSDNYQTCVNLMQKSWSMFVASTGTQNGSRNDKHHMKDEESQEEDRCEGSLSPNYVTCINPFRYAMNFMLIILGIGFPRIMKIQEKKVKHVWAKQIMDKLMEHEKGYKYSHNGQSSAENLEHDYGAVFAPPDMPFDSDEQGNPYQEENNKFKKNEESDKGKIVKESQTKEKSHSMLRDAIEELFPEESFLCLRYQKTKIQVIKETPILAAAKRGITEMVNKILEIFPLATLDVDEHEKNALLLAIENRQTKVYNLLMKKTLPEVALYQVDDEGNSALHLAATFQPQQPWQIPGAALQLMQEIKWYKYVERTLPSEYPYFYHKNQYDETAKQIFTRTHETLAKDGWLWLFKTSKSCSVVATLVATLAFEAATDVPGGFNFNAATGDVFPVLTSSMAFKIFCISSLVAFCFSVTALLFFLAILMSRSQGQKFRQDLPQKLLLGLTCLFISIAGILLSFYTAHFTVVLSGWQNPLLAVYGMTCLPITFFAIAQLPSYFDLLWSL